MNASNKLHRRAAVRVERSGEGEGGKKKKPISGKVLRPNYTRTAPGVSGCTREVWLLRGRGRKEVVGGRAGGEQKKKKRGGTKKKKQLVRGPKTITSARSAYPAEPSNTFRGSDWTPFLTLHRWRRCDGSRRRSVRERQTYTCGYYKNRKRQIGPFIPTTHIPRVLITDTDRLSIHTDIKVRTLVYRKIYSLREV